MSVQGLGPQYNAARPQQFGARKPQQGAPKFGFTGLECCVIPCAAPILLPIGGFFLYKLIKRIGGGLSSAGSAISSQIGKLKPKKGDA